MNDDVKKLVYGTILVFLVVVLTWLSLLFLSSCGFTLTCRRGDPLIDRTPVPTLIPATLPVMSQGTAEVVAPDQCRVPAVDFIGAWVDAGSPEHDAFQFTDVNRQTCEATFEEVQPLFSEANLWATGAVACTACHSLDVAVSPAQLDLSSYAGVTAGSRRENAEDTKGTDILGGGDWENSLLYEFITTSHTDIPGHTEIDPHILIFAGKPLEKPEATATVAAPEATATPTP
jgi:hypothetical protein